MRFEARTDIVGYLYRRQCRLYFFGKNRPVDLASCFQTKIRTNVAPYLHCAHSNEQNPQMKECVSYQLLQCWLLSLIPRASLAPPFLHEQDTIDKTALDYCRGIPMSLLRDQRGDCFHPLLYRLLQTRQYCTMTVCSESMLSVLPSVPYPPFYAAHPSRKFFRGSAFSGGFLRSGSRPATRGGGRLRTGVQSAD